MWALGDKATAEGIALFTYPTAGYFDAFFYALMTRGGRPRVLRQGHAAMTEGIWDPEEDQTASTFVAKLADYTEPSHPVPMPTTTTSPRTSS